MLHFLFGLVLLVGLGWLVFRAFLLAITSLLWLGEKVQALTSKQWIIGSLLFVILSVCSVIVAPAIALPTIMITLLVIGLLVPFLAGYSDAKGKALIAPISTGSRGSQEPAEEPMLVLE